MLIIGHRGAAGLAPENTIESLQAGVDAGADILEFDIRLTSDSILVLSHDARLHGKRVSQTSLKDLQAAGAVTTFKQVLDTFFGVVMLNIEFKPTSGAEIAYNLIKKYVKSDSDWSNAYVSSFHIRPLLQFRRLSTDIKLALLHSINPFAFVTYQRRLKLSAVGWHRLHTNNLAIEIAKQTGLFTYVYTVNRPDAALRFERRGVEGIVTDHPDKFADLL